MNRAEFPVITGSHWAEAIKRGRDEGNAILLKIRAAHRARVLVEHGKRDDEAGGALTALALVKRRTSAASTQPQP